MRQDGVGNRLFFGRKLKMMQELIKLIKRIEKSEAEEIAKLGAGEIFCPIVCFATTTNSRATALGQIKSRALKAVDWTIKAMGVPNPVVGDDL